MLGVTKKKLIIVVDDKTASYGELMAALISMNDDKVDEGGDNIVYGVEDGTVETVIWTEKIYADNQAQLGSNNKVLFIGNFDAAKAVQANILTSNDFYDYGINYGSLGNKAVIYVDKKALTKDKNNYEKFYNSYCEFIAGIDTDYANNISIPKVEFATDIPNKQIENKPKALGFVKNKAMAVVASKISGVVAKGEMGAKMVVAMAKSDKEVQDQQYRCAVFAYYIYSLAKFME